MLAQGVGHGERARRRCGVRECGWGFPRLKRRFRGRKISLPNVMAEDPENIADMRAFTARVADVIVEAIDADEKTVYEPYYDFAEQAKRIPNHRVLAVNRGEKEGKLRVRVKRRRRRGDRHVWVVVWCADRDLSRDALDAAIADTSASSPPLERELRSDLTERAQPMLSACSPRTRRLCCSSVPCATRA